MSTHEKETFFGVYGYAETWQDLPWAHDAQTDFLTDIVADFDSKGADEVIGELERIELVRHIRLIDCDRLDRRQLVTAIYHTSGGNRLRSRRRHHLRTSGGAFRVR